jgi:hypothetical protein
VIFECHWQSQAPFFNGPLGDMSKKKAHPSQWAGFQSLLQLPQKLSGDSKNYFLAAKYIATM